MPKLSELKVLTEFIVSDDLDTPEFILYYNFCMADLSEITRYEKNMTAFNITNNSVETSLPADFFEVVSIIIEESDGTKSIAEEVVIDDDIYLNKLNLNREILYGNKSIYSVWNRNLLIKSDLLIEDSDAISLNVKVKYSGSLPTLDYTDTSISLDQLPPIVETHYHHIIANYIAYMYFLNAQDKESSDHQLQIYLSKKAEMKYYIEKHRFNKNKRSSIRMLRRI